MDIRYGPSETIEYGKCPMLWALRREGWRPNYFSYNEVSAAVGTGIHYGAFRRHRMAIEGIEGDTKGIISDSIENATQAILGLIEAGCYPERRVEDWESRIEMQVGRGVAAYLEVFPTLYNAPILAAEESFGKRRGDGGYAGCVDLIIDGQFGPAVVDIKTKQGFKSTWARDQFLAHFAYSWQMYHYTALVATELIIEIPRRFYLCMIELAAKPKVTLHSYAIDRTYLNQWRHAVEKRWAEMDAILAGDQVPAINDDHVMFGRNCPMHAACLTHKLDESLMGLDYIKLGE